VNVHYSFAHAGLIRAVLRGLDLLRPSCAQTAAYGHLGRDLPDFTWERTDRVDAPRRAAGAPVKERNA